MNKTTTFDSPGDLKTIQDRFDGREPGLTHPDNKSFIRLRNNGDIEVSNGEGASIILHGSSITLMADSIKIHTSDSGFKWNGKSFNSKANHFDEPTLIDIDDKADSKSIYRGVDYFTEGQPITSGKLKITDPSSGEKISLDQFAARFNNTSAVQEDNYPDKDSSSPNNLREI